MPRIDSVAWLGAAKGKKVKITQVDSGAWLRKIEAARLLGVSIRQLERLAQEGSIAMQYLPRTGTEKSACAVYSRADIEALLKVQEEAVLADEISRHLALINEEALNDKELHRNAAEGGGEGTPGLVRSLEFEQNRQRTITWQARKTQEERSNSAKLRSARMTVEKRSDIMRNARAAQLASSTPEQRSASARHAAKVANVTRWASQTALQRSEFMKKVRAGSQRATASTSLLLI